jgi:hypothetical protein
LRRQGRATATLGLPMDSSAIPMQPAAPTTPPSADPPLPRRHFHPLEIIPVFRRWPASRGRDLAYTFIWSCLFGVFFYALGAFTGGKLPSLRAFGLYLMIANFIGYSIHFLYAVGAALGLDAAAIRAGNAAKVAYYSAIPMAGVLMGMALASLVVDVGLASLFTDPAALLSLLAVSLVISTVLSVIFFWRERSAVADAALARERERSERIEREAVSADLRALQAQIEPHFLFNTLANVASLLDSDPATARHMLESFIRFLRASLAATREASTTLGDEAELIGAFLDVLQVRMGPRLAYRIEVPEELRSRPLPPMLLQPLVENAIRHGLEPKVEGGEVSLRARREGEGIVIEIADTGVGFGATTRGGLGLANLRGRLELLYRGRAHLAIGENTPAGTLVRIYLPA